MPLIQTDLDIVFVHKQNGRWFVDLVAFLIAEYDAEEFRDAKDLWKIEYAHATFKEVGHRIKSLLEDNIKRTSPEYYPVSVGIICMYCRPFTDNDLVGKIPIKIVPNKHREIHDRVCKFRNEIFAHTAGDAILGHGEYMNAVKLRNAMGMELPPLARTTIDPKGSLPKL
jgi:hypothetical protein